MSNQARTPRSTTNIIKAILPLHLLCLCMACGNSPSQSSSSQFADTAMHPIDTASKEPVYETDDADEIQFAPRNITTSSIGKATTLPSAAFDPAAALRALYPGNYYTFPGYGDSTKTERLVSWRCTDCKQTKINSWDDDEPGLFPYPDGNMTTYTDTLNFTDDDGRQNMYLILSTIPLQPREFMFTGRFSCATLNIAWYVAEQGRWKLKLLSPALGCYGAFQTMPDLHLVKLARNNYGCYLFHTNGGAGGPFYSDVFIFGIVNGQFASILEESGVQRFDSGMSEWKAAITGDNSGNTLGDLKMTITGMYSKNLFENDTISNLPKEIITHTSTRDSLNFTITREYYFTNGTYRQASTKTETR